MGAGMGASNARIMVVEDDSSLRDWIQFELGFDGYEVKQAADGARALQDLRRGDPPDLILLDVQMPGLSGLDAARQIRVDSCNRDTPIIATTANAFAEDAQACRAAGMDDHLPKPIEPERLFERMLQVLRRR